MRQVPDDGVVPFIVVESFDVTKYSALCLLPGQEKNVMDQLSFQSSKKGFGDRVVIAALRSAHTLQPSGSFDQRPKRLTSILRAMVRMKGLITLFEDRFDAGRQ